MKQADCVPVLVTSLPVLLMATLRPKGNNFMKLEFESSRLVVVSDYLPGDPLPHGLITIEHLGELMMLMHELYPDASLRIGHHGELELMFDRPFEQPTEHDPAALKLERVIREFLAERGYKA